MKFRLNYSLALFLILTVTLLPAAFAGKVYKWVDKDGNVHYGAEKPSTGAQELKVKSKPSSSSGTSEEQSSNGDEQTKKTDDKKAQVSSDKEAAEIEKKNAEIRKKNCSNARKRAATIENGGRLYEVDESGERHYWDDDTRRSKQEEAEAQIKEWCK